MTNWKGSYCAQAEELSAHLGLRPERARDALDFVAKALGERWLEFEISRIAGRFDVIIGNTRHPIAEAIRGAGLSQLVEITELAAYMQRLHQVSGFKDWLVALRSSYFGGIAQASQAYRFLRAGCSDLALEPGVLGGRKADIRFKHLDTGVYCECYCPEVAPDPTGTNELSRGLEKAFILFASQQCRIDVRPRVPVDAVVRKRIVRTLKALSTKSLPSSHSTDEFDVEVSALEEPRTRRRSKSADDISEVAPNAAWVARSYLMDKRDITRARREEDHEFTIGVEFVVHPIPGFDGGLDWQRDTLVKRIAKKAQQARAVEGNHRLLIVGYPRLAFTLGEDDPITRGLVEKVAQHLTSPCDILFVDRRWGANSRYVCLGELATVGRARSPLCSLIDRMREDELDRDPIADEGFGLEGWPRHRSYFGKPSGEAPGAG